MRKGKTVLAVLVLMTIVFAFTQFGYASPEEITLSQYSGAVGTNIIINGTGFAANSDVTIMWDFSEVLNETRTDSSGNFTSSFHVPEDANGQHLIAAIDAEGNMATTSFTVVASVTLNPSRGVVGSLFDVIGHGFSPNTWVTVYWDDNRIGLMRTNNKGSFTLEDVEVPESTYGRHTVTAVDENLNTASAIFFVESNIEIRPHAAYVGVFVTVTCTGYSPNSVISIIWDPAQPTEVVVVEDVTSNVGSFTGHFHVPEAVNGDHFVAGVDSNGVTATTIFTVVAHLILQPSSGYVGEVISVHGTGFSSNSNVTLRWDMAPVATTPQVIQTSAEGSFNASFQTPQAVVGAHTVEATDAHSVSSSASFNIAPHLVLEPDNGPANSFSTVICTGFSANANITVIWDPGLHTQQTLSNGITNSSGAYTAYVTIPSATNGSHVVEAIDWNGNVATTLFWVGPKITIVPDSGYVETQATIYGSNFGANKTVTILWDVEVIGTASTDGNGSFIYAFTVPHAINGMHRVTAIDQAGNTAYTYYIVYAHITVSETSGHVGDIITINGTGFANTTIVTVYWDGMQTQRGEISNTMGDVTLTFMVPESSQGVHEIQCIDSDGNPSNIIEFTVNPKIVLSTDYGYVGDTIAINGTGFAANSLVRVTWDGVSQYAAEISNDKGSVYIIYSIPPSSTGLHVISAYDQLLNKPDGMNFTVLPPAKPVPLTPLNGTSTKLNVPTFSWTSVPGATTYSLQYSQDKTFSSGVTTITQITETEYTLTVPLDDGVWYWRVQALDAHLNPSGYSDAFTLMIDTVPPTSSLAPLDQYQNSLTFNLAYQSSDGLSGVAYVELYFSYNGGNFEKYGTYFVQNGTISFYASYGDGQYAFYTVAVDNAGNIQEVTVELQTIVDTTPPTSYVNPLPRYTTQRAFNIAYTASDGGSGISYVTLYYSTDGGETWIRYGDFSESPIVFTAQSDGRYMFLTVAVDNAGNVESTREAQAETVVDTIPPVTFKDVEGVLGNGNWYTSSVTITLTSFDDASGVNATYFSINDGAWQRYGGPFNITSDGIYVIHYYSVDNAGNAELTNLITVKVDKTAPYTTSDAEEIWYSRSPVIINLTASDGQSGVAATYWRLDGEFWTESTTVTIVNDGIHTIEFYSVDVAGNVENIEKIYVRVDGVPPAVEPQQIIENNVHIAGTYKFIFALEDEAGISSVVVYIDGVEAQKIYMNPQTGLYEFSLDTTTLHDGEHTIAFSFTDNGNHTVTVERTFIVDNTPPLIGSITPDFSVVQSGSINLEVSIMEGTNVSAVYLSVDDGEWVAMTYSSSEKKAYYELRTSAGDNGLHRVKIKLVDTLGNSKIYEYVLRVDNPTYTLYLFIAALAIGVALLCLGVRVSRKTAFKAAKKGGGGKTE